MTFRVLVADSMAREGIQTLENAPGVEVRDAAGIDRDELLREIKDFDPLVVRSRTRVDSDVIAAGSRLQIIGRAGIGVDNIDVRAATRAGVVVMNTPDGNATTTAEHALALMFAMARNVPQATMSVKAGKWEKKKLVGRELFGKTLGVVGLGNVGRVVANRGLGLHMRVIACDPLYDEESAARLGVELVVFEELLRRADVVTVHTPLNDEMRNLIGDAEIDCMKHGVMLVNCARGGIYDEEAVLRRLESGKVGAAAFDVFVAEPPPIGSALVQHERFLCTPHLGASTREAQVQVAIDIAEQIADFAHGGVARNAVNLPEVIRARGDIPSVDRTLGHVGSA